MRCNKSLLSIYCISVVLLIVSIFTLTSCTKRPTEGTNTSISDTLEDENNLNGDKQDNIYEENEENDGNENINNENDTTNNDKNVEDANDKNNEDTNSKDNNVSNDKNTQENSIAPDKVESNTDTSTG